MDTARPLRDVFADLTGHEEDTTHPDPATVLESSGHADLPPGLVAEAVGSYADTAPIEVAEHLSPYVMAHSAVPLPDGPDVDPGSWLDSVVTAPDAASAFDDGGPTGVGHDHLPGDDIDGQASPVSHALAGGPATDGAHVVGDGLEHHALGAFGDGDGGQVSFGDGVHGQVPVPGHPEAHYADGGGDDHLAYAGPEHLTAEPDDQELHVEHRADPHHLDVLDDPGHQHDLDDPGHHIL